MKNKIFVLVLLFYTVCCYKTKAQSGAVDTTFNIGSGANGPIWSTAIQNDGKIIIGGAFTVYNGIPANYIARLNTDGSLDTTFNLGVGANNWIWSVKIQSDDKIIIGGRFTLYDGFPINRIARLNSDGTLDTTFNPGTGVEHDIYSIALQSDGKIIIVGDFQTYNAVMIGHIARLNSDGTLDGTFIGTGTSLPVYTIALQNDYKILVGGMFTLFNGVNNNYYVRLNKNGSLDSTFQTGTGFNDVVYSTVVQNDGKILVGGAFTSYNGIIQNYFTRLNSDGSIDASFNSGYGADNVINEAVIQSDNRILIGGGFTSYNGTLINRIARLNTDGTIDTTFNPGTGTDYEVRSISIQSDGKIIVAGNFSYYNGVEKNRIVRLLNSTVGINEMQHKESVSVYPNPVSNEVTLEINTNNKSVSFAIVNASGRVVSSGCFTNKTTINVSKFSPGIHMVMLTVGSSVICKKIIIE